MAAISIQTYRKVKPSKILSLREIRIVTNKNSFVGGKTKKYITYKKAKEKSGRFTKHKYYIKKYPSNINPLMHNVPKWLGTL